MDEVFQDASQVTDAHMHGGVVPALQYFLGEPENMQ